MTVLDGTLSELARLRSGSEPIVTLYRDVRWSDERQRERVRLFVDPADGLLDRVLRVVREGGADLHHVNLAQPSLEDVYIHLTGRGLRE